MADDTFSTFKQQQKEGWGLFAPLEIVTTMTAADLVRFSRVTEHDHVLDVGCGTGVVAITAARIGATVSGLDLSPALIERAKRNQTIAEVRVDFQEGDVEALPYADETFDAVLSQFGHMFAPRPHIALREMLRVLKPGGTIAFSTWPPELFVGRLFKLVAHYCPPPADVTSPSLWGDPNFIRTQFDDTVDDIAFDQGCMQFPALSLGHYLSSIEKTLGPVVKMVENTATDPNKIAQFRAELKSLAAVYYSDNHLHQHFLLCRAKKK